MCNVLVVPFLLYRCTFITSENEGKGVGHFLTCFNKVEGSKMIPYEQRNNAEEFCSTFIVPLNFHLYFEMGDLENRLGLFIACTATMTQSVSQSLFIARSVHQWFASTCPPTSLPSHSAVAWGQFRYWQFFKVGLFIFFCVLHLFLMCYWKMFHGN